MKRAFSITAVSAFLVATGAAEAATVKGKLASGRGFTVVALAPDGRAVIDRIGRDQRFALRIPARLARGATLQLIGRDGSYYGPVVLRREGRRAFLALSGRSVDLKLVRRGRGAARPARFAARRAVDRKRVTATDAGGRPRGAGRLGLVGSRRAQASDHGPPGGGGGGGEPAGVDSDADGIPGPFDVDDDGDKLLDTSDPNGRTGGGGSGPDVSSSLPLALEDSLNLNATGVTRSLIDERLVSDLNLLFTVPSGTVAGQVDAVDVQCGGLVYCRAGTGTAIIRDALANAERGRWVSFDPNGDGLPNLEARTPVHQINVWPRVGTADLAPGDAYTFIARAGGAATNLPASLVSYFTTTPATRNYDSGAGPTTVSYPVAPGTPGTRGRAIELASERLAIDFWRPQRLAIEGAESGTFMDIGHLNYGVRVGIEGVCRPEDYSNLSPTLAPAPAAFLEKSPEVVLRDSRDDAPPNSTRLLSFTIDVGACLRRQGIEPAGKNHVVSLTAEDDARNIARQHLTVRVP